MTHTCALMRTVYGFMLAILLGMLPQYGQAADMDLTADHIQQDAEQHITATGHATVQRGKERMTADSIRYDAKQHIVHATGRVHLHDAHQDIHAEEATMQTQDHTGSMQHASIQLAQDAHIQAAHIERLSETHFQGDDVRLSVCPKDSEAWHIHAQHMNLDQQRGVLTANHAVFYLGSVPLLYTPYWQQPLRRQSGLLIPEWMTSSARGSEWALPYYWAPRPDWDVTLTPRWMSLRGLMGSAEVRHAGVGQHQTLAWSGIRDQQTHKYRQQIQGDMLQQFNPAWQFDSSIHLLSDHQFLSDFAIDAQKSATAYTYSTAKLSWRHSYGDMALSAQYQQNLRQINDQNSLQILPRLESHNTSKQSWGQLHFDQQTTRFSRIVGVQGTRIMLHPWWNLTQDWQQGGIQTELQMGARHLRYSALRLAQTAPRTMLDMSMITRIHLEHINSQGTWRHALTPIIRYDLSSAPQQSNSVNFDSGFAGLTMNNLMQGNRFTGYDRFERMHRLSFLLDNTWQYKASPKQTARTWAHAQIGVAYDLLRQTVDANLQTQATRPFSNILGSFDLTPSTWMQLSATGQWNPVARYWASNRLSLNLSHPQGHHVDVTWQRQDARYGLATESITANAKIALATRWQSNAHALYDRKLKIMQDASLGIRYQHPCWHVDVEVFRNAYTGIANTTNTGVRFLLGFQGLGKLGGS